MSEIRWGIIGCGNVTEIKSGPAFNLVEGARLVAVMRRDGEKAEDYAKRHKVPKWTTNAEELINDDEVDAVYIATPPSSHAEYAKLVAATGKPVYVEKPMAISFAECQEMNRAYAEAKVPLFVAFYRRCLPKFLKIQQLLEQGRIGHVRFVSIFMAYPCQFSSAPAHQDLPWRYVPEISGGGLFVDLASHQLDYLDYILGPIVSTTGHKMNQAGFYPAEDIVTASFAFDSGIVGNGVWCFTVAKQQTRETVEIVGSNGKITFSTFWPGPITIETAEGREELHIETPKHIQQPLIQTIVDELHGKGKCPSNGETAARTTKIIEQILNS